MQLRTCKNFIRFVLLLIVFQFLSSSIAPESGSEPSIVHKTIHIQFQKSLALSFFFEENKNEREEGNEENRLSHSIELIDLSLIPQMLTRIHAEVTVPLPVENHYKLQPPLFKLYSVFII
jgi:hypothetical protein